MMPTICQFCRQTYNLKDGVGGSSHGICPQCELDDFGMLLGAFVKLAVNPRLPEPRRQAWRGA